MTDGMKSMAIDRWYKVVIWLGAAGLILSISAPLQVPNISVFLISLGAVSFGIGQWINHPLQTRVVGEYKITGYNRLSSAGGLFAEFLGLLFFVGGLIKLWPAFVS